MTTTADINPVLRAVFVEGKTVCAPFSELAAEIVDIRLIHIGRTIAGLQHACICPLRVGGQIEGCLTFLTARPLDDARRRTCEAFAQQVALTLENTRLLAAIEAQMERLRENEAQLRLLTEQLPAILWATDSELRFIWGVGAGLRALNLRPNQLVGTSLFEFFHTEDADFPPILAHRQALQGSTVNFEITWLERTYHVRTEPLQRPGGGIIGCIGVALDITERQRAEQALRDSEARWRAVIATSPDAIALTDLNANIRMCNPQALTLLGYESPAEVVGSSAFEFFVPQDRQRALDGMLKTLSLGKLEGLEYTLLKKDGTHVSVELSAATITNSEGNPEAFMAIVRDTTERRRVYQALGLARQELGQLEGVRFAAREVAHLLNNDLVIPMGVLDELQHRGDVPSDIREDARQAMIRLKAAVQHVVRLQQVVRVETKDTPVGPALDLDRSTQQ
ncbi:MAG: PAS domain S-box protein [Chloroflexota bacterium]|nr:PAS domain S-box protein [Chloroflexota bacterium]